MPYDPDAAVAGVAARLSSRLVTPREHLRGGALALQLRGAQRLLHRDPDRVKLVIARHLLGERAAPVVLEHDEVADEREKPVRRADALQHHLELGQLWTRKRLPRDGAPGLEPLPAGGQRADAGLVPVRDDESLVHGEQGGQLRLVGLELPPCRPDGGVLVRGVLQLDDAQGQAVDEQHHVRPARVPVLGGGELVDRQPVVVGGNVEVDDPRLAPFDCTIVPPVLHRHAVDEHPVEGVVAGFEGRSLRAGQLPVRIVQRRRGQAEV